MKSSLILNSLLVCSSFAACAVDNDLITKSKDDDERIEHLAITTLANMAQGIVNIGNHSDDSKIVEKEVANIMANFTVFVIQAMKNHQTLKIDEEELVKCAAAKIRSIKISDNTNLNN